MKYLKRFNESLENYNDIVEDLKDMLIPLRDENPDYLYDVSRFTYRDNELLSIDVRIWKDNFSSRSYNPTLTVENIEEIKPVVKQMVSYINSTEEFDQVILLVNYWDEEGEDETSSFGYSEKRYDSLIISDVETDFYNTIVEIKLKFVK